MTRLSWGYGPRAPGWAMICALVALCALLLPTVPASRADTPLDLDAAGRITDTVGALGKRRVQVEMALDRLHTDHHVQLYVTYVHDFSGRAAHAWADATADRNGFGPHDILLAIATHGGQYAVSADKTSGFRKEQLERVATAAIAPALKEHDWAGAAIGAADGYRAVLRGEPVPAPVIKPGTSDPGGDGMLPGHRAVWVPIAGGALVLLTGLALRSRRARAARRRPGAARARPAVATSTEPGLARLAQPLTTLPDLDAEASANLVDTDDAVRTSAEELRFATAQLGTAATRPFAEAVAYARGELADAFRLRQHLDDAPYEEERIRRHALDEICSRCTSANRRLDAESEAFDRLRGLKANAAAIVDRAEATARGLNPRVAAAEAALAALAHCRARKALAPVAGHPGEARDRLSFADTALAEARTALLVADPDHAAVSVRAAEAALSQAATLTAAVLRHTHALTAATTRLRAVLAEASGRPEAAPALKAALRAMAHGPYDPREVLRLLDEAMTGEARAARTVLTARAEVSAARDYISTHRGAIGCRARTRLTEAERHIGLCRGHDVATAVAEATRAMALAQQARALAEDDVLTYGTSYDDESAPAPARALGGALLGGIILAGLLPATFGGGATRGRLAG
ncbi:TPM domain-containing protein [Streptomyces sp. NPDC037389]|uniref:TPM domain-containing protein n=1 Tax=Streptomyces sp. NPDC037389 TaxID=3155369 RepID=UPI0033F89D69